MICIAAKHRELLPHIFTFTVLTEVIFCGTISFLLKESRLFTGELLCAVRTFLPSHPERNQRAIVRVCRTANLRMIIVKG